MTEAKTPTVKTAQPPSTATAVPCSATSSAVSADMNTVCTMSSKSAAAALYRPNHRFGVTLLVFASIIVSLFVASCGASSPSNTLRVLGGILTLLISFFAFIWMRLHSSGLSKKRRAFFNEANILETYQPRARTMGHLFHPDPPTPSPFTKVQIAEPADVELHSNAERDAFNANRDAHYANMFQQAMMLNRDMDAAGSQSKSSDNQKSELTTEKTQMSEISSSVSAASKTPGSSVASKRTGRSIKLVKRGQ